MTAPTETAIAGDTQLPADVENPVTTFPTHTAGGKPVIAIDNGTSRPRSAPIGADLSEPIVPIDADSPKGPAPVDAATSDGVVQTPVLLLPRGIDVSQIMALTHIVQRRGEQDAKWGGPTHDDGHTIEEWLQLIEGYLNQAEEASRAGETDETIDKLIDAAALACACLEASLRQAERLDQAIAQRLNDEAAAENGGDSTGLAGADEADASVDAGGDRGVGGAAEIATGHQHEA